MEVSGNSGQKIFHVERIQERHVNVVRGIIKFITGKGKVPARWDGRQQGKS
jgi:hypothetical protein